VYDLETSRIGAPYIYDISNLRVKLTPEMVCIIRIRILIKIRIILLIFFIQHLLAIGYVHYRLLIVLSCDLGRGECHILVCTYCVNSFVVTELFFITF